MVTKGWRTHPLAVVLAAVSMVYVVGSWTASFLIDFRNVAQLRDAVFVSHFEPPFLWVHLFTEGSPVEILQWFSLGMALVFASVSLGRLQPQGRRRTAITFLVVGLLVMVLEDAGNLRHQVTHYYWLFVEAGADHYGWLRSMTRSVLEVAVYAVVGVVMTLGCGLMVKDKAVPVPVRGFLAAGYVVYFVAALFSATRNVGAWYIHVGNDLLGRLTGSPQWVASVDPMLGGKELGFWFMDYAVEEPLELIGATLLCLAMGSLVRWTPKANDR